MPIHEIDRMEFFAEMRRQVERCLLDAGYYLLDRHNIDITEYANGDCIANGKAIFVHAETGQKTTPQDVSVFHRAGDALGKMILIEEA